MHTQTGLPISKNGYLYVYVSNETPNIEVFFDNLQVTHIRGPLLQEESYYPFGLEMSAISTNALNFGSPNNNYKFNGGDEWEESLNLYSTFFRGYDQQIGRFRGVDVLSEHTAGLSAYQFSFNNPISFNDPLGNDAAHHLTQEDLDRMLSSANGGHWDSENGTRIFADQEEGFGYGAAQMSAYGMWGGAPGWACSFGEALNRFNGGIQTRGIERGVEEAARDQIIMGKAARLGNEIDWDSYYERALKIVKDAYSSEFRNADFFWEPHALDPLFWDEEVHRTRFYGNNGEPESYRTTYSIPLFNEFAEGNSSFGEFVRGIYHETLHVFSMFGLWGVANLSKADKNESEFYVYIHMHDNNSLPEASYIEKRRDYLRARNYFNNISPRQDQGNYTQEYFTMWNYTHPL